jgi:hypothetical protein
MQSMAFVFVKVFFVMLLAMVVAGCGKGICIQGTGEAVTETRAIEPFTQIDLYNRVNVIVTQDTVNLVQVEAGRHLLAGIETSVNDNVLTIADKNTCNWARDLDTRINVYVHTTSLQTIDYYGSGDVSSTNTLQAGKFTIDSREGVGSFTLALNATSCDVILRQNDADVTLSGVCDFAYLYCGDQGKADLRNLVCKQVNVDHKGIYDAYVYATDTLSANVLYKGNVYYKGQPYKKQVVTTNSGQLISLP